MKSLNKQNNTNKYNLKKLKREFSGWLLLLPTIICMYFIVWRPQVMGFVWSLFSMKGYSPEYWVGIQNYIDVVTDTEFFKVLWNTIQYVLWSFVIGFTPPIILAVFVNEMVKTKNFFKTVLYLPTMLPGVAVMLMWYLIYYPDHSGLLNTILSKFGSDPNLWLNNSKLTIPLIVVAMTWKGFGSTMLLYFSALQGVNNELYEAAVIDGAGMMKRVWHVTLPQIAGIIVLSFITQIINVFQVTQEVMTMTAGGPNGASISLGYQLYNYGFVTGRVGHALALGGIMFAILIVFTCFYFYLNKKVEDNLY